MRDVLARDADVLGALDRGADEARRSLAEEILDAQLVEVVAADIGQQLVQRQPDNPAAVLRRGGDDIPGQLLEVHLIAVDLVLQHVETAVPGQDRVLRGAVDLVGDDLQAGGEDFGIEIGLGQLAFRREDQGIEQHVRADGPGAGAILDRHRRRDHRLGELTHRLEVLGGDLGDDRDGPQGDGASLGRFNDVDGIVDRLLDVELAAVPVRKDLDLAAGEVEAGVARRAEDLRADLLQERLELRVVPLVDHRVRAHLGRE